MTSNFIDPSKTVAFTGYRPNKLHQSDPDNTRLFSEVQARLINSVYNLAERGYTIFLSGMAEGFDLMAARAVLLAQSRFPNLELIAVMPFPEQARRFDPYWKDEHRNVLKMADSHLTVSSRYYSGVFHRRNEVLIDHCSVVVCYYDGQPGGTRYTVELAQRDNREIINLCETPNGRSLLKFR